MTEKTLPNGLLDLADAIRVEAMNLEALGVETARREGEVREIRERLKIKRDAQNSRIKVWNERTGEKVSLVSYDK